MDNITQMERRFNDKIKIEKFVEDLLKAGLKIDSNHHTNLKYKIEHLNNHDNYDYVKRQLTHWAIWNLAINDNENKENIFMGFGKDPCFYCGKSIQYKLHGNTLVAVETECYKPQEIAVQIAIPSGKLLLADWPEEGGEVINFDGDENINYLAGEADRSYAYSFKNIMHFFVGNTCPDVYQKDNTIYIGHDGYDDNETPLIKNSKRLGNICTDLWWITGIDYEDYQNRLRKKLNDPTFNINEDYGDVIVNVKPGIYKCTNYFQILDRDASGPQLYTKMEWIKDIN